MSSKKLEKSQTGKDVLIFREKVVYFEHNPEAVKSAQSVAINTYLYDDNKKDINGLKKFLDVNLTA